MTKLRCKKPCLDTDCRFNLLPDMFRYISNPELRLLVQTGFLCAYHLDPDFTRDGLIMRFQMPSKHPEYSPEEPLRAFWAWEIEHTCLLELTPLYSPEDPMPISKIAEVFRCSKTTAFELLQTALTNFKEKLNQTIGKELSKNF